MTKKELSFALDNSFQFKIPLSPTHRDNFPILTSNTPQFNTLSGLVIVPSLGVSRWAGDQGSELS